MQYRFSNLIGGNDIITAAKHIFASVACWQGGGGGTCIKMEREAFFFGRQAEGEYLGVWGAVSGFRGSAP